MEENAKEVWKEIDFTDRKYEVSNLGRVRSFANGKEGKVLKGKFFSNRLSVDLRVNGKRRSYYIHRLVADYFLEKSADKPYVQHKNGDTLDNRVENLEWVTEEVSKSQFYKAAKLGISRTRRLTQKPKDGKEYFLYAGFYFRVHDSGGGKFIRLTVAPNITKSVSLAEIVLERKGEPKPGKEYVILYKDGNCYNVSPNNLRWITRSEKSKLLLSKNMEAYMRVREMGKKNKKHFVLSEKQEQLIRSYREKGRTYTQISKLLGVKYSRLYKYCKENEL